MPLYEYQCQSCGEKTEVIQKFSDPLLKECKSCGGELEKLLSAPAIQFKGKGWYVTDYGRKDQKSSEESKEESKDKGKDKPKEKASKDSSDKSSTASKDKPAKKST